MEISPTIKKIIEILMRASIGRCRLSGNLCRISVNMKFIHHSDRLFSVKISVSDTGVGCEPQEFYDVEKCLGIWPVDASDWDGELYVTSTSINDKDIQIYKVCLKETTMLGRVTMLCSQPKNDNIFSGSEVSFSFETAAGNSIGDYITWTTTFMRKDSLKSGQLQTLILKVPMIVFEVLAEHVTANGSNLECILQSSDGILLPNSLPNAERFVSGLQEYVFKHRNNLDEECTSCFPVKEHLKLGNGFACSRDNKKSTGHKVEVVIAFVDVAQLPCNPCSWTCSAKPEVLYFQNFSLCSDLESTYSVFKSIDWKNYGLILKTGVTEGGRLHGLEWVNSSPFTQMEIAIHYYDKQIKITQAQKAPADKKIITKAIKLAFDDVKSKYGGILMNCHASKVQDYAPDLSRTIAGLILSSKDVDFQVQCASLLGLQREDISMDGRVESCIKGKVIAAIEMKKSKTNRGRKANSCLFECEKIHEEDRYYQNDEQRDNRSMDDAL